MVGNDFADALQRFGFGGAHHVHDLVRRSPAAAFFQHRFIQPFAGGFVGKILEIFRAFVGGQHQDDGPFAFVSQERGNGIQPHIRSQCDGIEVECFKKSAGVQCGCVADVAAFGIGNQEDVFCFLPDVTHGFCQAFPAPGAQQFVKGKVRLVGYGQVMGGIHDGFVEFKNRIRNNFKVFRDFIDVRIQTYTQERSFFTDQIE